MHPTPNSFGQRRVTCMRESGYELCMRASVRTTLAAFSKPPRLSTPWALTLSRKRQKMLFYFQCASRSRRWLSHGHTSSESASAAISAALPLITVGCHASSSSGTHKSRQGNGRTDYFTPHDRDVKTLTGSDGPTECRGANTDGIEHHRLPVLIRVAARSDHPVVRLHGPEIDEQTTGNARKICLFGFSLGHDGRAAQRERDVGGLCLHDVVRDLV